MPLGKLSKETIKKARKLLQKIKDKIEAIDKITDSPDKDVHKMQELYDERANLSSEFYTLIPHAEFAHDVIKPIEDAETLRVCSLH